MNAFKVDKQGYLCNTDDEGNITDRVKIDGQTIKVSNALTQETIDRTVQERLNREKKQNEEHVNELIVQYEEKLKTAGLSDAKRKEYEDKITELEKQLSNVDSLVARRAKEASQEANIKLEKVTKLADARLSKMRQRELENSILKYANGFVDPADVVTFLSSRAEWVKPDGAPEDSDDYEFSFKIDTKDDKGEPVTRTVNTEEAIKLLAKIKPHWVEGSGNYGGGGPRNTNTIRVDGSDLSKLSSEQKMALGYEQLSRR